MRMQDCKEELHGLLQEDVRFPELDQVVVDLLDPQRLAGASLLVFANKQDIQGSMTDSEIRDVSASCSTTRPNALLSQCRLLTSGPLNLTIGRSGLAVQ